MAGGFENSIGILVEGAESVVGPLSRASDAVGGLVSKVDSSVAPLTKASDAMGRFIKKTEEASEEIVGLDGKFNLIARVPSIDTSSVDALNSKLRGIGIGAVAAGGAVMYGMKKAVDASTDFDTAMAEVSTLVDTSEVSMGDLSKQVLGLSKEFGVMPVDTAKTLYTTISSGFADAADATLVMQGAMKLAKGGITDVGGAVDGLTSIMNSYGIKSGGVAGVSDAMFVAMKMGKTTIGELSGAMGKVTPLASAAGVGLDELMASVSALTLGGLATNEAVTALRGVISGVIKPTADAQEAAKRLGIDFSTAGIKSMGFANWLDQVKQKTGGSDVELGKLFGSVEGLSGVLALVGPQANSFNGILEAMKVKAGATEEAFKKVDTDAASGFSKAKASLEALQITIGDQLQPALGGLSDTLTNMTGGFTEFADAHPILARLAAVLPTVSAGVAGIGGAALVAGLGIKAAMAAFELELAPVLLIAAGIAAAITGLVMIFSTSTEEMGAAGEWFSEVWEGVKDGFDFVVGKIAFGLGFMAGIFGMIWGGISDYASEVWPLIQQVVIGAFTGIVTLLGPVLNMIWAGIETAWNMISIVTSAVWDAIKLTVVTVWNGVYDAIKIVWDLITGLFKAGLQLLTGDWSGAWATISETFSNVWEGMKSIFFGLLDWIKGLASIFVDAGKALVGALWDGIVAAWDGMLAGFEDLLAGIEDLLPGSDAKEGPLSHLTASGSALVNTFGDGINSAGDIAAKTLTTALQTVRELLPFSDAKRGPLSSLTQSGASVLPTFAEGILKTRDKPMEAVAQALGGMSFEPVFAGETSAYAGGKAPSSPAASKTVVFQPGAIQVTMQAGETMDNLEERLTEILSRVALRLGVADA